jgi:hypothetical protein
LLLLVLLWGWWWWWIELWKHERAKQKKIYSTANAGLEHALTAFACKILETKLIRKDEENENAGLKLNSLFIACLIQQV